MTHLYRFLGFLLLAALLHSCANSHQVVSYSLIQKRKHTKGFYVDLFSKQKRIARPEESLSFQPNSKLSNSNSENTNVVNKSTLESISIPIKPARNKALAVEKVFESKEQFPSLTISEPAQFENILLATTIDESPSENEKTEEKGEVVFFSVLALVLSLIGFFYFTALTVPFAILFGIIGILIAIKKERKGQSLGILAIFISLVQFFMILARAYGLF